MAISRHPRPVVHGRPRPRRTHALAVLAMTAAVGAGLPACGTVSATATPQNTSSPAAGATASRTPAPAPAAGVACRPTVPVVRPTHVPISCGDGSAFAIHVRWTALTVSAGKAVGVVLLNDCTPSCARGHFKAYAARLTFTRVRTVGHRPLFTRLLVTFTTRRPAGAATMAARY